MTARKSYYTYTSVHLRDACATCALHLHILQRRRIMQLRELSLHVDDVLVNGCKGCQPQNVDTTAIAGQSLRLTRHLLLNLRHDTLQALRDPVGRDGPVRCIFRACNVLEVVRVRAQVAQDVAFLEVGVSQGSQALDVVIQPTGALLQTSNRVNKLLLP